MTRRILIALAAMAIGRQERHSQSATTVSRPTPRVWCAAGARPVQARPIPVRDGPVRHPAGQLAGRPRHVPLWRLPSFGPPQRGQVSGV